MDRTIIGAEVDMTLVAGKDLSATSPCVRVGYLGTELCRSAVAPNTVDPVWNQQMKFVLEGRRFRPDGELVLTIYDADLVSRLRSACASTMPRWARFASRWLISSMGTSSTASAMS